MDNKFGEDLALKIVAAENAGSTGVKGDVQKLLSPRFVGITRGGRPETGEQEEDREQFIAAIMRAEPNSPLRVPSFDDQHSGAWAVGDGCWVVKGKVATRNKGSPEKDPDFRNTWIFFGRRRMASVQSASHASALTMSQRLL
jgi:hypothetical protein